MVSSTHTVGSSPPESSSASTKTFLPSIPSTLISISPLSSPEPKAFSTRSPSPPQQTPPYRKNNGWLGFISDDMEVVLKVMKDGLTAVHVPYAYGFAIILLAPYPLTKQQSG